MATTSSTSASANSASIRASPRSQASLRRSAIIALAGAGDEVDDLLASGLDRRAQQRHDRGRGGGEPDGEHDPVDEAVAALLAADALGCLEELEEERVEHAGHLPFMARRSGRGSEGSRRRAGAR